VPQDPITSDESERAYRAHNHGLCIDDALINARQVCERKGARFTDLRKQVFTLIWGSHQPLGAYTILEKLVTSADGSRKPAPPTVYRALTFLLEHGLIHRIASLNAFIGCAHPNQAHSSQFLICRNCNNTAELCTELPESIKAQAEASNFHIESVLVELTGLCPNCSPGNLDAAGVGQ
jgi:Fur family zinc uptake transcriptional regulator